MQKLRDQMLNKLNKQIEIAIHNQESWKGKNSEYEQYWIGQKHALRDLRADLIEGFII